MKLQGRSVGCWGVGGAKGKTAGGFGGERGQKKKKQGVCGRMVEPADCRRCGETNAEFIRGDSHHRTQRAGKAVQDYTRLRQTKTLPDGISRTIKRLTQKLVIAVFRCCVMVRSEWLKGSFHGSFSD